MNGESAQRIYTLKQATGSLPGIVATIRKLTEIISHMERMEERLTVLELICGRSAGFECPDVKELLTFRTRYHQAVSEMQSLCLIAERSGLLLVELKPPLVHFLTRKNGEIVFLCWKEGEARVQHWHPLDQDCQEDDMQRHLVHRRDGFI